MSIIVNKTGQIFKIIPVSLQVAKWKNKHWELDIKLKTEMPYVLSAFNVY